MSRWANQLEDDLSWREAELGSLKTQVAMAPKMSTQQTALLRAMWAMLYAHFEGFCKFAWDTYLDALASLSIKRKVFRPEICQFSMTKEFKILNGDLSAGAIFLFCEKTFNELLEKDIEFKVGLETDSNLWPNLFKENIEKICISCASIESEKVFIKSLVARRNDIAHGKKLIIDSLDEYQKYENSALLVMHDLAINIVDSLEKRTYLKEAS